MLFGVFFVCVVEIKLKGNMKIIINSCYGGYGISDIALKKCLREVNAELLETLKAIKNNPNTRHEVESQLGKSTWDIIAKAERN